MKSEIVIALVVLVVVAAHIALFRWVKFKVHEGVILRYLRDAREEGIADYHGVEPIAVHTELAAKRVTLVCRKSAEIQPDPDVENSWCAK